MTDDDLVGREVKVLTGIYRNKVGVLDGIGVTRTPEGHEVRYYRVQLPQGPRTFMPHEVYVGGRAAQVTQVAPTVE